MAAGCCHIFFADVKVSDLAEERGFLLLEFFIGDLALSMEGRKLFKGFNRRKRSSADRHRLVARAVRRKQSICKNAAFVSVSQFETNNTEKSNEIKAVTKKNFTLSGKRDKIKMIWI